MACWVKNYGSRTDFGEEEKRNSTLGMLDLRDYLWAIIWKEISNKYFDLCFGTQERDLDKR